jgi:hypothetical protein
MFYSGGADEGMIGHENAYKVCWPKNRKYFPGGKSRLIKLWFLGKGFAYIGTKAEVPIVPIFLANVEEMRWNPILAFWNLLGLGRLFSYILELNIPIIRPWLVLLASTAWFLVTFLQIPIPAKLTLYVGDPVQYDMRNDSIDVVSLF